MLQGNLLCFLMLGAVVLFANKHRIQLPGPPEAPPAIAYTFGYGSLLSRPSVAETYCGIRDASEERVLSCPAAAGFRVVRIKAGLKRGW